MDSIKQINTDDLPPPTRLDKLGWWWGDLKYRFPGGYRISRGYWKVKRFFFPARPRLLKAVGREWKDIRGVVEDVLFQCVIDYVELEKGLTSVVWTPEEEIALKDMYDFCKVRLPALYKDTDAALDKWYKHSVWAQSFAKGSQIDAAAERSEREEHFSKLHDELEETLDKEKTKYLHKVVDFRNKLWT